MCNVQYRWNWEKCTIQTTINLKVRQWLAVNTRRCTMVPLNLSLHHFLEDYFNCQSQFTCPSAAFHRRLTASDLAEGRCFALAASL